MYCFLVEFACYQEDNVKTFLLGEKEHDAWCMCEPPQGYKHFKTIWHGEIYEVIGEVKNGN